MASATFSDSRVTRFDDYSKKYRSISMRREDGIVEMVLHTGAGPLQWDYMVPRELSQAFSDVGSDPDNRVLILTGTGASFSGPPASSATSPRVSAAEWEPLQRNAASIHRTILDIPFPVISCLNGPAERHAEFPLLADIVLAASTATIRDSAHFANGMVPGDGINIILPVLIGWNRAKYYMLTGRPIPADEALRLGIVSEVLAPDDVLPRAWGLARELAQQPPLVARYTRLLFTHVMRRALDELQGYGLALEGLAVIQRSSERPATNAS